MEVQQIMEMLIEMKADRKADRTHQEQILKSMQEKADAGQAEIIAAIEKRWTP
jgi:hypothetical protein